MRYSVLIHRLIMEGSPQFYPVRNRMILPLTYDCTDLQSFQKTSCPIHSEKVSPRQSFLSLPLRSCRFFWILSFARGWWEQAPAHEDTCLRDEAQRGQLSLGSDWALSLERLLIHSDENKKGIHTHTHTRTIIVIRHIHIPHMYKERKPISYKIGF